jgi:hypothetical protein
VCPEGLLCECMRISVQRTAAAAAAAEQTQVTPTGSCVSQLELFEGGEVVTSGYFHHVIEGRPQRASEACPQVPALTEARAPDLSAGT